MRKITFFTLAFSTLLIWPAMAQLGRVWTDFQYYSVDFQNYLRNNLSDTLQPLEATTQNALNSSSGDLNIPNPVAAGQQARQSLLFFSSIPDKFDNNQAVHSNLVSNEMNRVITRSAVVGVLGREAQNRTKNKLENTERTITNIERYVQEADQAQNLISNLVNAAANVANNPLLDANKNQANLQLQSIKIQSEQAKLVSETLAQSLQTNQFLQYSNLNLANISQQMEEANRARRVDTSTEAARLLRTTSQIDLFGRDINN